MALLQSAALSILFMNASFMFLGVGGGGELWRRCAWRGRIYYRGGAGKIFYFRAFFFLRVSDIYVRHLVKNEK